MYFGLIIIALCFLANPLIGLTIFLIILWDYSKKKKSALKNIENKDLWPKICPPPGRTADSLLMYRGCTVEIFKDLNIVRIIKPCGKDLGVNFESVSQAVESIDEHV